MFTQTLLTTLLIWTNQIPITNNLYFFENHEQIYSLNLPEGFYINSNIKGAKSFSNSNFPLTTIELDFDTKPKITEGKYEVNKNLTTHKGQKIEYYEDTEGQLWNGVGCDIQAMCIYPELKAEIYQISCQGKRNTLSIKEICQSLKTY